MRLFPITLSCLFVSVMAFGQGPITAFFNAKGSLDLAVSYGRESYQRYRLGREFIDRPTLISSWSIFSEYSLSNGSSLVVTLPYLQVDGGNQGWQDAQLFLKLRTRQTFSDSGQNTRAVALGLSFPVAAYETTSVGALGQQALRFQARFLRQYQADSGFFMQFKSGLDFQLAPEAQFAIPVLGRLGYGGSWFFAEGWLEWYESFSEGNTQQATGGTGADWWRLGGSIHLPIRGGLGGGLQGAYILAGRNIGLSTRWGIYLLYRL